ncbi:MAG: hypothetical protein PWQ06_1106 [Anaerophaga sp.]|nr:hypothetical protein [Anaerophaga sp.]
MTNIEKKEKFQNLLAKNTGKEESYYTCLEEMDDLKTNYNDYMTTAPIDVETELKGLPGADYDLCEAFLTMILREDHLVMEHLKEDIVMVKSSPLWNV